MTSARVYAVDRSAIAALRAAMALVREGNHEGLYVSVEEAVVHRVSATPVPTALHPWLTPRGQRVIMQALLLRGCTDACGLLLSCAIDDVVTHVHFDCDRALYTLFVSCALCATEPHALDLRSLQLSCDDPTFAPFERLLIHSAACDAPSLATDGLCCARFDTDAFSDDGGHYAAAHEVCTLNVLADASLVLLPQDQDGGTSSFDTPWMKATLSRSTLGHTNVGVRAPLLDTCFPCDSVVDHTATLLHMLCLWVTRGPSRCHVTRRLTSALHTSLTLAVQSVLEDPQSDELRTRDIRAETLVFVRRVTRRLVESWAFERDEWQTVLRSTIVSYMRDYAIGVLLLIQEMLLHDYRVLNPGSALAVYLFVFWQVDRLEFDGGERCSIVHALLSAPTGRDVACVTTEGALRVQLFTTTRCGEPGCLLAASAAVDVVHCRVCHTTCTLRCPRHRTKGFICSECGEGYLSLETRRVRDTSCAKAALREAQDRSTELRQALGSGAEARLAATREASSIREQLLRESETRATACARMLTLEEQNGLLLDQLQDVRAQLRLSQRTTSALRGAEVEWRRRARAAETECVATRRILVAEVDAAEVATEELEASRGALQHAHANTVSSYTEMLDAVLTQKKSVRSGARRKSYVVKPRMVTTAVSLRRVVRSELDRVAGRLDRELTLSSRRGRTQASDSSTQTHPKSRMLLRNTRAAALDAALLAVGICRARDCPDSKLCAAFLEHAPIDGYHTPELIADALALNRYLLYHCPDYRAELSSIPAS